MVGQRADLFPRHDTTMLGEVELCAYPQAVRLPVVVFVEVVAARGVGSKLVLGREVRGFIEVRCSVASVAEHGDVGLFESKDDEFTARCLSVVEKERLHVVAGSI